MATVTETTTETGIEKTVRKTDKIGITPGNTTTEYDLGDGKTVRTVTRTDWSATRLVVSRKLAESVVEEGEGVEVLTGLLQEIWETVDRLHVCGSTTSFNEWVSDNWWPEDANLYCKRSTKKLGAIVRVEYSSK